MCMNQTLDGSKSPLAGNKRKRQQKHQPLRSAKRQKVDESCKTMRKKDYITNKAVGKRNCVIKQHIKEESKSRFASVDRSLKLVL